MTNQELLRLMNESIEQEQEAYTRYVSRRIRSKASDEYNGMDDREIVAGRVELACEL